MKLIVGLGNPGSKYINNRHNVGFMFVDYLSSIINHPSSNIKLIKPQTFMNNSGIVVKKLITNYQLQITDLFIVHDDLDIPLGKFKIQMGTGPKLHNGLASIEQHLKTKDFLRIRIGVDNRTPVNHINGEAYVLQNFLPNEREILAKLFPEIYKRFNASSAILARIK